MKIQRKTSLIFRTDLIFALISRHFMISWIFNSIWLNLFDTGSFIWDITFHNLKYLDKPKVVPNTGWTDIISRIGVIWSFFCFLIGIGNEFQNVIFLSTSHTVVACTTNKKHYTISIRSKTLKINLFKHVEIEIRYTRT